MEQENLKLPIKAFILKRKKAPNPWTMELFINKESAKLWFIASLERQGNFRFMKEWENFELIPVEIVLSDLTTS